MYSRCSWLGECVVVTVCCVVCVIEYGWYVGRGDCGVCGWKDRCRDGNLRTYCQVSPILFGWFFAEASPTCFYIFVKCFFCNLRYTINALVYLFLQLSIPEDCYDKYTTHMY